MFPSKRDRKDEKERRRKKKDRISGRALRLHDDSLIAEHKKLVDIIHNSGIPVLVQLGLGDYEKTVGDRTIPSVLPDDLDEQDIEKVESLFEQGQGSRIRRS